MGFALDQEALYMDGYNGSHEETHTGLQRE